MALWLWCWSYKPAGCLELCYSFWQRGKGRGERIANKEASAHTVDTCPMKGQQPSLPDWGQTSCHKSMCRTQRKRHLNLHVRAGKRKEPLTVIRMATKHKPWEAMTGLKCFCMKNSNKGDSGLSLERLKWRGPVLRKDILCVYSCKQQQEVNHEHERLEISLSQETGAYAVG